MNNLADTVWIELRKAIRSRMPWMTALGFLVMPLASAFIMFIYKDPEFAQNAGLISAKANLMAGAADWPTYLSMLAQATAIGGILLFSLVCSWVFGREFADGTLKDLLALPVARSSILLAKFFVVAAWSAALTMEVCIVGLVMGALIKLPQGSFGVIFQGSALLAITACLVIAVVLPFALFASVGRGYLLPVGFAMLALLLANVIATLGWGSLFPWSVPALYAGMGGQDSHLPAISYWIVVLTGLAGMIGTDLWWRLADQG